MGGGDLNTKKTWHPSTLKNQERVWKAEQAAAEEKKRIAELQRERAVERDREELNALAKENLHSTSQSNENRLHWMYDKPDKKVQQEDYLLGKAIDKNYDKAGKSEENEIPAVSRRVVGSSMITSAGDVQVDLARKLREDPLLLVKERERAARAALLNNPVQRRKLTELLRKEQEQKILSKEEKKSKKKNNDLDDLLAAKLNALGGRKGMDIAKLLESDDSSSESSSMDESKKKKKKKKKKSKKKKSKKSDDDSDDESQLKSKKSHASSKRSKQSDDDSPVKTKKSHKSSKKRNQSDSDSESNAKCKNSRHDNSKSAIKRISPASSEDDYSYKRSKRDTSPYKTIEKDKHKVQQDSRNDRRIREDRQKKDYEYRHRRYGDYKKEKQERKKPGLSEEEKAARLVAMAAAGAEREIERSNRVREQRAEKGAADTSVPGHTSRNEARVLPDSLESRIHSNRHYIQRDHRHMNEHFARRK